MALAYESITVATTAIGFTASNITSAYNNPKLIAVCILETGQIRFRTDGTDPTSTEGAILEIGQELRVTGGDVPLFKAIRTGSVSGVLKVHYFKGE